MTVANLGIRNSNAIIAYNNTTKRTKWIPLVLTTDITCPQTGFAVTKCLAQFEADSAGQWSVDLSAHFTWDSATVTSVVVTFVNLTVYNGLNVEMTAELIGKSLAIAAVANSNASTVTMTCASTGTTTGAYLSGKIPLKAEPTTYTTAANMETYPDVSVYIPPASASLSGIVTTGAQTIAGVKTLNDSPKLAATKGIDFSANTGAAGMTSQLLNWYEEGTWVPVYSASNNLADTGGGSLTNSDITWTGSTYTRIGRLVTAFIVDIAGIEIVTAGNQTYLLFTPTGLPGVVNSTKFFGGGLCRMVASPNEVVPIAISEYSVLTTDIFLNIGSVAGLGVASGDHIELSAIYIQYII